MYSSICAKKTAAVHAAEGFFSPHRAHVSAGCCKVGVYCWAGLGPGGSSVSPCDVWIMSTMAYFVSELGWELGVNDKWRKPQFSPHKKTLVLVVRSFQNNTALPIRPGVGEDTC